MPKPQVNKVVQNRILEKNFVNNQNIKTTEYKKINNKDIYVSAHSSLSAKLAYV